MKGIKFLGPNLSSNYDSNFFYPAPTQNEKGEWIPTPWITIKDAPKNGEACDIGLHIMKKANPKYGRYIGNCYEAEGKDKLGEDEEKARFRSIRLIRPITFTEIFKPKADLSVAYLSGAYLSGANLVGANLTRADLAGANLTRADLAGAYLSGAYLVGANLAGANLSGAYIKKYALSDGQLKESLNTDKINWVK